MVHSVCLTFTLTVCARQPMANIELISIDTTLRLSQTGCEKDAGAQNDSSASEDLCKPVAAVVQ